MHLRRALLLFAIVLGVAAIAAALSRDVRGPGEQQSPTPAPSPLPTLEPGPVAEGPAHLRFDERGRRRTLRLRAGRSAVVTVEVDRPGQVELRGLGLTANAEPLTPARFDVRIARPGRHEVRFIPAAGRQRVVGALDVTR